MKTRYRMTAVLFVAIALVAAACGGTTAETTTTTTEAPGDTTTTSAAPNTTTTAPPEPVTLHLITNWGPDDAKGPVLQAVIAAFEAENPDITVEVEIIPDDMAVKSRVETAFLAGEEPDIILNFGPTQTGNWIPDGVTVPVTDYVKEWGLFDNFLEPALAEYTVNDELVAFPIEGFAINFWYNMDILEKSGVTEIPGSTTEFLAMADAVRAAGFQPLATSGGDWFMPFIISGTDDSDAATLQNGGWADNANIRAAVEEYVKLRDGGAFIDNVEGTDFATVNELYFSGQAAVMYNGTWAYGEAPADIAAVTKIAGEPFIDGAPKYDSPWWWSGFGAKGLHISRNGLEKIAAVENFVKFFFSGESIAMFVEDAGMIPPLKDVPLDTGSLNPLFTETILVAPSVTPLVPNPEVALPQALTTDFWFVGGVNEVAIPGTTVDDILALIDAQYGG